MRAIQSHKMEAAFQTCIIHLTSKLKEKMVVTAALIREKM